MDFNINKYGYKPSDIFECEKCGECCKGYGGTFVTDEDIKRIASYIDADKKTFKEKYCAVSGGKPVLVQADNGYCIFWDELCTIHPVKPRMCRAWPFIESVIKDTKNWGIMSASCIGINTNVPDDLLKEYVKHEIKNQGF